MVEEKSGTRRTFPGSLSAHAHALGHGARSGIWQTSPDSAFKLSGFERLSSQVPGLNPVCGHHRHVSESDISTLACIQYPVH